MSDLFEDMELPEPTHVEVRWQRVILTGAGILLGAFALVGGMIATRPRPPQKKVDIPRVGVEVYTVRPREVQPQVVGLGRTRPRRAVSVAARVSGQALSVHDSLRDGMFLAAGDVAVQIDPVDFQHNLSRVAAQLDAAQAEEARLRAQVAHLASRVDVGRRQLQLERDELARIERLRSDGVGTDRDLEVARISALRAEDTLINVQTVQAVLAPQIESAAARVREAEVALEDARLAQERTTVRAPFAGQVAHVAVEAGEQVSAGATLFELWETEVVEVPVVLTLGDAALLSHDVRRGLLGESDEAPRAQVTFRGGGTVVSWEGLLRRFEPVDPLTQTVKAVVEVRGRSQNDLSLPPNVFCRVTISTRPVPTAAAIPLAALQERDRVYLVRDGVLDVVEVEVGRTLGGWVEIQGGLAVGDQVITSSLEKPIEGTPLTVTAEAE